MQARVVLDVLAGRSKLPTLVSAQIMQIVTFLSFDVGNSLLIGRTVRYRPQETRRDESNIRQE